MAATQRPHWQHSRLGYCAECCQDWPCEVVQLREENARLRAALERIAAGVDHPHGIGAPNWYEAIAWAQGIANEALEQPAERRGREEGGAAV